MLNYLVCYEESGIKKWEMTPKEENSEFVLSLLKNKNVDNHTIFVIPSMGIMTGGIWVMSDTHKSQRVDFANFHNEYGKKYVAPKISDEDKKRMKEYKDEKDNSKYGWISPDGSYFHCCYQGHVDLADKICFGMVDTNNGEKYLEEHGWCKIYKSLFEDDYHVFVGGEHVITKEQMQRLISLGLENAKDISKMLCKD